MSISANPWWGIIPPCSDYPPYIGDPIPDPNRVGDFPLKKSHELFWQPQYPSYIREPNSCWSLNRFPKETTVWFDQIDGGQKFVLELAGYSKDQIKAKIEGNILAINKAFKNVNGQGTDNQYEIPSVETLDLEKFSATMENGLLEISFPPKKNIAPKTIVIL